MKPKIQEVIRHSISNRLDKLSVKIRNEDPSNPNPEDKEDWGEEFVTGDEGSSIIKYIGGYGGTFLFLGLLLEHKFHHLTIPYFNSSGVVQVIEFIGFIFRDIGLALVIAAFLGFIIEVPSLAKTLKERILDVLKDHAYLKSLSMEDLERIKRQSGRILWKKKGKRKGAHLNNSLIKLEEEVNQLLEEPYYEFFRINIQCENDVITDADGTEHEYIRKTVNTHYQLVNPLKGKKAINVFSQARFYCPESITPSDLWKISEFEMQLDGKAVSKSEYKMTTKDGKHEHPKYNIHGSYKKIDEKKEFVVEFDNQMSVKMTETRMVIKADPIYVHRVSKPTKSFILNYHYADKKSSLKADWFGTNPKRSPKDFELIEENDHVNIESFKWLLPGNGVFVAVIPRINSQTTKPNLAGSKGTGNAKIEIESGAAANEDVSDNSG